MEPGEATPAPLLLYVYDGLLCLEITYLLSFLLFPAYILFWGGVK